VAFPTFSRMQHDVKKVGENALMGIRLLSFFAFPLMWGMSSIAPEIVEVMLGPKWLLAIVPLQVLALIIPFRIVSSFIAIAAQGMGRSDILLVNTVWAAVVAPPILFVGAYAGGLIGLSLAWLVISPMLILFAIKRYSLAIGLQAIPIYMAALPAAGAAFSMYGAVALARYFLSEWHGGVLRMALLILVGAMAYCAVSFAFNRKGVIEVVNMMQSIALSKRSQQT